MLPFLKLLLLFPTWISQTNTAGILQGLSNRDLFYVVLGFFVSFLIGFILSKLLSSEKPDHPELTEADQNGDSGPKIRNKGSEPSPELLWRHEKLALTNQQNSERQDRLSGWVGRMRPDSSLNYPGSRVFFLSESVREERNQIGADLSRLGLVEERMGELTERLLPAFGEGVVPEEITAWRNRSRDALEDVGRHREVLRDRQKRLGGILSQVSDVSEKVTEEKTLTTELSGQAHQSLDKVLESINDLPGGGLHSATKKLSTRVEKILGDLPEIESGNGLSSSVQSFANLHEVISIDSSISTAPGKEELAARAKRARDAFDAAESDTEALTEAPKEPEDQSTQDLKEQPEERVKLFGFVASEQNEDLSAKSSEGAITDSIEIEEVEEHNSPKGEQLPDVIEAEVLEKTDNEFNSDSDRKTVVYLDDEGREIESSSEDDQHEQSGKDSTSKSVIGAVAAAAGAAGAAAMGAFHKDDEKAEEIEETTSKQEDVDSVVHETSDKPAAGAEEEIIPETEEEPVEAKSSVVFCGNDPKWWNQNIYRGANARGREVASIPESMKWLSIERKDTGEKAYCRIDGEDIGNNGEGKPVGFNGSNELFYDARHLGIFAESCEGEVETRFTYGGWGFGHRVSGFDISEDEDPPQASGWAGKEISPDTVFEIVVYEELPEDADENDIVT